MSQYQGDIYSSPTLESEIKAIQVEIAYENLMKTNERSAILAIIRGLPMEFSFQKEKFQPQLDDLTKQIKDYISRTLTGYISDAYEGKGADAAKHYLTSTLKKPKLENPMRNC